jgi:subtilisin-like proprotein convertase family protein
MQMAPVARARRRVTAIAAAATVLITLTLPAAPASAATRTGSSSEGVTIDFGLASPYPSVIDIDAPGELVTSVSATITLTHDYVADVLVLLAAPDGSAVMLMSEAGCGGDANAATLTFTPTATTPLPQDGDVSSGTYRPTQVTNPNCVYPAYTMPSPAPTTWGTSLADLVGATADGEWQLFVADRFLVDSGSISSWSLSIETAPGDDAQFTSEASVTGAVGTPFEHELTATGFGAPSFSLDEEGLPGGLSFDGSAISGTPTEAGEFVVPVTASNGYTADDTQDLQIEILERPAGPLIERAPGQGTATNQEPVEFAITFPEVASGFAAGDVQVSGTAGGGVVSLTGSGTSFVASVSELDGDGTVFLEIADESWQTDEGFLGAGAQGPEVTFDTTAPTIDGPPEGELRAVTEPGKAGARVYFDFLAPEVELAFTSEDSVSCSPASGSFFAIGTTSATCTATDLAGNAASTTFEVTVVDEEAPVFGEVQDLEIQLAPGEDAVPFEGPTPEASDNSGEVEVTCDLAEGTTLVEGHHAVECLAEDPSGNTATASFTVSVLAADAGEDDPIEDDGDELAETGGEVSGLGLLAVSLLAVGAVLVTVRRRIEV